jgi:hypothetical protein
MNMEQELEAFAKYCATKDYTDSESKERLKTEDTVIAILGPDLKSYITYLKEKVKLPGMHLQLNGGAQFRRLMIEVEVFVRFSSSGSGDDARTKKDDILQAGGLSGNPEQVIKQTLNQQLHKKMEKVTLYVAERLQWFFLQQKEATLDFMATIKGSPEEHMFSKLLSKKAENIQNNGMMKDAIFSAFDACVESNRIQFKKMWIDYLHTMFEAPISLMKGGTMPKASEIMYDTDAHGAGGSGFLGDSGMAPTFEGEHGMKARIKKDMERREMTKRHMEMRMSGIKVGAEDTLQHLLDEMFTRIRCLVADQMQLYAESFFLLPMLRRLEGDMAKMEMAEADRNRYKRIVEMKQEEGAKKDVLQKDLVWCIDRIQDFKVKG